MWQAIQFVGSGLSLVAFVVAAVAYAYRAKLDQRAKIISSAPEKERIEAITATAELFRLDLSGLTNKQKQELALAQIQARSKRDSLLTRATLSIAVILAALAIISMLVTAPNSTSKNLKSQLIGRYQVRLGKNGGCNGGQRYTYPKELAKIYTDGSNLIAQNECGQTSSIEISGYGDTIYFYGESAHVATNVPALTITDDIENTWEKLP